MIHGPNVHQQYTIALHGRLTELLQEHVGVAREVITDKLMEFKDMLRNCKHAELAEWYELYKDIGVDPLPIRLRSQ